MKKSKITKAVIAVAGYGTRFLPATKNQPKEMLPIIDKPIIHYLVEEAVASGIKDIILVTRHGGGSIEDYFDNHYEIEDTLKKTGKDNRLQMVKNIPQMANFAYVRQKNHLPYGNATPLLSAANFIDDDESFVFMFGDDLTISQDIPITKQLINVFEEQDADVVLGVQEVPDNEVERYATVKYKENANYKYEMELGLEKMPLGQNPSNMAQFGRFVMNYKIIEQVKHSSTGKDNELWVIDVINDLAKKGDKVIAQPVKGEWLTTGDPERYIKATLKFAMMRDDLKEPLTQFIKTLLN